MQEILVKVYSFNELSKKVQDEIVKKELYSDYGISYDDYNFLSDDLLSDWKDQLEEIGFNNADIKYTGFNCQGDGCCFTCKDIDLRRIINIDHLKKSIKHITFLTDESIQNILDDFNTSIEHADRHYCHCYSVSYSAYTDTDFDYKYQRFYNALSDYIIGQISDKQRFFANKIYKELENLYYNCYSDEHVREWFKNCCDSVFLENGKEFEM